MEILEQMQKYENRHQIEARLEIFSDGSGNLIDYLTEEILFDFDHTAELETKLELKTDV